MLFHQLAVIISLSRYVTGDLCVDSSMAFKDTKNGNVQTCTDTQLKCDASPIVRSHCKVKCGLSYCCEDTIAPFFEVLPENGTPTEWRSSCKKAKKYCKRNQQVASACPVTCKKCTPLSTSDIFQMINTQTDTTTSLIQDVAKNDIAISDLKVEVDDQVDTIGGLIQDVAKNNIAISGLEEEVNNKARGYRLGIYEYVFVPEKKSWADHNAAAVEWGGHMASVHTIEEAQFIWGLSQESYTWIWIDGERINDETFDFANTDGTPFDYTSFHGGYGTNEGDRILLNFFAEFPIYNYPGDTLWAGVYKKVFINL